MRPLLIISCLLIFIIGKAQVPHSLDSLKVFLKTKPQDTTYILALNDYAFQIIQQGNFDDSQKIINQMQYLSDKLHYGTGFYKAMNMRGVVEYSKQNPKKAMDYFLKANEIITKYKLPKKLFQNSLNNIGIIYSDLGDRDNATLYSMKLIDFQEKNKPLGNSVKRFTLSEIDNILGK